LSDFVYNKEPPVLLFLFGRLAPLEGWGAKLAQAYQADFGNALYVIIQPVYLD